jgi:hypothetical protein
VWTARRLTRPAPLLLLRVPSWRPRPAAGVSAGAAHAVPQSRPRCATPLAHPTRRRCSSSCRRTRCSSTGWPLPAAPPRRRSFFAARWQNWGGC